MEDENSETGFCKMTMEEELNGLERAFQKMADGADAREMIEGEFQRLKTEGGKGLSTNASKKPHRRIMLCLCGLPGGEGVDLNEKAAKGGGGRGS